MALLATSTLEGGEKEVPGAVEAPSLKYILSHYPPQSRQGALESLAVYGLRSLLAHFRLDQFLERGEGCLGLAFLTETTSAAKEEVKTAVKDHYYFSRHKRGSNKVGGVKKPNQPPVFETEDEVAKQMEKEMEKLRILYPIHSRPDVLEKYPFVDSGRNEEGGGVAGALCSSGSIGGNGTTATDYFTTTAPLEFNFTGEKCASFPTFKLASATERRSLQKDAMPGFPQFHRLAKREIRHIAENVFQEFHSSAHGMHVTDLVRALQTLIEGDNASPLSYPCGMHLIRALAEEVLPSEIKFGLEKDSEKALSECFAPSMGNFAMEGDVGGAVARDDATISRRLWISVVWHIVKRLRELESSGILGDGVDHHAGSSTHHLPSNVETWSSADHKQDDDLIIKSHHDQEEWDCGPQQPVIKKKTVQSQHKQEMKAPKAGSAPLGMIGVTPPPHMSVILAAKAQKAAQEMKQKRYQNSSSNGRTTEQVTSNTRLAMRSDRTTYSTRKLEKKEAAMRAVAKERLECYAAGDLDSVQRGDSSGELAIDIANAFLACNIASKCGISVHSDSITDDKDSSPLPGQEEHDAEISHDDEEDKEIGTDNNDEGVAAAHGMKNSTQTSSNSDDNGSWEMDDEVIE